MEETKPNDTKEIYFRTFGQIEVISEGRSLNEDTLHSEKVMRLLSYLLLHREQLLSVQQIGEVLWKEDETDNPSGALKNLMYRLRNGLKALGEEPYVLTSRGSYRWNPEIPVRSDYEEFEKKRTQIKGFEGIKKEKIKLYEEALELYQGPFLAKLSSEHWVVAKGTYFHSMYLSMVEELADLYDEFEIYDKMEQICETATRYDPLEEYLHYMAIKALIGQGKYTLALQRYEQARKILYDKLGIRNSSVLKEIYEKLISVKNIQTAELETIHHDMQEEKEPSGLYICEYAVFKEIYRLEARRIGRMGIAEHVALFTLEPELDFRQNEDTVLFFIKKGIEKLEEVLKNSLRIGDVAARYSENQYIILLPTCTFEEGNRVAERILEQFTVTDKNHRVKIRYDIEEVSTGSRFVV